MQYVSFSVWSTYLPQWFCLFVPNLHKIVPQNQQFIVLKSNQEAAFIRSGTSQQLMVCPLHCWSESVIPSQYCSEHLDDQGIRKCSSHESGLMSAAVLDPNQCLLLSTTQWLCLQSHHLCWSPPVSSRKNIIINTRHVFPECTVF